MDCDDEVSVCSIESIEENLTVKEYISGLINNNNIEKKLKNCYINIQQKCEFYFNTANNKATDSHYFVIILAQTSDGNIDETKLNCLTNLLKYSISRADRSDIRINLGLLSKFLMQNIDENKKVNLKIRQNCLFCIGKWLEIIKNDEWKDDYNLNAYIKLLQSTINMNEEISKAAIEAIVSLFCSKKDSVITKKHSITRETLRFFKHSNTQSKIPEELRISQSMTLLDQILLVDVLDEVSVNELVEYAMKLFINIQIIDLKVKIIDIFTNLFRYNILSPEYLGRSLNFLHKSLESTLNLSGNIITASFVKLIKSFITSSFVGFESMIGLHNKNITELKDSETGKKLKTIDVALVYMKQICKQCNEWLLSDNGEVRHSANESLKRLTCGIFISIPEMTDDYLCNIENNEQILLEIFYIINSNLNIENVETKSKILDNLTNIIIRCISIDKEKLFNKIYHEFLEICPNLANLRDKYDQSEEKYLQELTKTDRKVQVFNENEKKLKKSIESYIGACFKVCGTEMVFNILPLDNLLSDDDDIMDLSARTWLIPLMEQYVDNSSPLIFQQCILPMIKKLTIKIKILSTKHHNNSIAALSLLRRQLWESLPSFWRNVNSIQLMELLKSNLTIDQFPNDIKNESDLNGVTLINLMVNMFDPDINSGYESVILKCFINLMKSNLNDYKPFLSIDLISNKMIPNCFTWYTNDECNFKIHIRNFLMKYMSLFDENKFESNFSYIMSRKFPNIDLKNPTNVDLSYIDLIIMLAPYTTMNTITKITKKMIDYLEDEKVNNISHKIQKKCYRLLEIITDSDTENSCDYTKNNINWLLEKLASFQEIKSDSRKCRIKTLYNLFKLLNNSDDIKQFLNMFLSELIISLNEKNKKTRTLSGFLIVEAITSLYDYSDIEEEELSVRLDKMIQHLLNEWETNLNDYTSQGKNYKGALQKAFNLILNETRLARVVTRWHIESILTLIKDTFINHDENDIKKVDRHLVYCGLNLLKGLLRKNTGNFEKIQLKDIMDCLISMNDDLRRKVRMPIKKIIRNMLKLWDYDSVKFGLPEELFGVARNVHKAMNRSNNNKIIDNNGDNESTKSSTPASSWLGSCDSGKTLKNPKLKSITEILDDSDVDDNDDELMSRMSGMTMQSKVSTMSKKDMRKLRKRRLQEMDHLPLVDENDEDDVLDLNDPRDINKESKRTILDNKDDGDVEMASNNKSTERHGYKMKDGKIIIGDFDDIKRNKKNNDDDSDSDDDDDDDDNVANKQALRFNGPKSKRRKINNPARKYCGKKGVMGDVTRKDMALPHCKLNVSDINSGVYKKYQKQVRKNLKNTRKTSKINKRK